MFQDAYNLVQWGGVSDAHILNITNYSKMPRYLMDPHSTYRPLELDTTEGLNDDKVATMTISNILFYSKRQKMLIEITEALEIPL